MAGINSSATTIADWSDMRSPALVFALALLASLVANNPGYSDNLERPDNSKILQAVDKTQNAEQPAEPARTTSSSDDEAPDDDDTTIKKPDTEPENDSSDDSRLRSNEANFESEEVESYTELPSPTRDQKKKFDFSKAVNLDKLPCVEGELTSYMGSYRINLKDGSRFQAERILQKTREAILESGMRGAIAGTIAGALATLLAIAIRAAAYRAYPKHRKDRREEQSGSFSMSTAVVSLLIAFSVAFIPIAQDAVKRIQTVDTPDYLKFTPVYSYEFGVRIEMPEPFKKYRIIHKAEDTESSAIFNTNSSPVPATDRTYFAIVHEEAIGGMALGFTRMPHLPQAVGNKYYHYDIEKSLDAASRQAIKGINGEVSYTCPINYKGKHPGRETEGKLYDDAGIFRQRLYITGSGNFVHAAVYGDPVWVNSNQAYEFLDSVGIRNN
ncbi:MAG: hypothetical protein K2X93_19775 [Candidatus Obscuribacterales bacterium]|nr:hypothetical protein [Candidatus Obscuribacterales bacterium]